MHVYTEFGSHVHKCISHVQVSVCIATPLKHVLEREGESHAPDIILFSIPCGD